MAKLTREQIKGHDEACKMLSKDVLSDYEKWFVIENWQESANHINSAAGAFFTPVDLAMDFAIEVGGGHVVDLCAGIGCLSMALLCHDRLNKTVASITCIEINPDYVAIGRKIVPEATWICGSIFDTEGKFDCSISNPPFGNIKRVGASKWLLKDSFDIAALRLASEISNYGAFILPVGDKKEFNDVLQPSCIDAFYHADKWRGVSPKVEVVTAEFEKSNSLFQ